MPVIRPFRGYLFDQSKVNIQEVVAPPYDVISQKQQEELYNRSPYNIVRLILGKEDDRYSSAARCFLEWQDKGVLVRDKNPAIYVLHQTFEGLDGRIITRKGFVALCKLEEFEKKIVLPHEKTLAKPREDRLKLMKATNANFSQVFSLYWDADKRIDGTLGTVMKTRPEVNVIFEDVDNTMWKLQNRKDIRVVEEFLRDKQVLIADGHHRYETAVSYRDSKRSEDPKSTGDELYNYTMMFFTNIEDEGLVIYSTHRIVHSLRSFDPKNFFTKVSHHFIIREFKDRHLLLSALSSSSARSFGVLIHGDPMYYLLSLKPTSPASEIVRDNLPKEVKELDVTMLHSVLLRDILGISAESQEQKLNLDYVKTVDEAVNIVSEGKGQLAFIMKATRIEEVRAVAKAGATMPQKSTYFYPKLVSGLVINKLAE